MEIQIGGNWIRSPLVRAIGTMISDGSTSSTSIGMHAAKSRMRPRPASGLIWPTSDRAISTFTGEALLQHDQGYNGSEDQDSQGRASVEVDELVHIVFDQVRDHHVRGRPQDDRRDEKANGDDEDENRGAVDTGQRQRENDKPYDRRRLCTQAARR